MKELNELTLPEELRYAQDHEWIRVEGDTAKVGISDYAQDQLGDVVYVDLPKVGDRFEKGARFGIVESVKAVSELFMPVGGEIMVLNSALDASPGLVNEDPYGNGWMIEIKPKEAQEVESLLTNEAYLEMLKGIE